MLQRCVCVCAYIHTFCLVYPHTLTHTHTHTQLTGVQTREHTYTHAHTLTSLCRRVCVREFLCLQENTSLRTLPVQLNVTTVLLTLGRPKWGVLVGKPASAIAGYTGPNGIYSAAYVCIFTRIFTLSFAFIFALSFRKLCICGSCQHLTLCHKCSRIHPHSPP